MEDELLQIIIDAGFSGNATEEDYHLLMRKFAENNGCLYAEEISKKIHETWGNETSIANYINSCIGNIEKFKNDYVTYLL
jgi:hypothetical protein